MKRRNREEIIDLKSFSNDLIEENTVLLSNTREQLSEKMIDEKYLRFKKNLNQLNLEYNFSLVYAYAFFNDGDFENTMNDLKMGYGIAIKDANDVEEIYVKMKSQGFASSNELANSVNDHLNLALALQRNVLNGFKELKDIYLNKISMTATAPGLVKNSIELGELAKKITNIVNDNSNSLKKAYEVIFYHSGDMILKTVRKIVSGAKLLGEHSQLDIRHERYYISSDCIITLEVKEWTDLYNKLKFVFKMLVGIDKLVYNEVKNALEEFEANYMVIILYEEKIRLESLKK